MRSAEGPGFVVHAKLLEGLRNFEEAFGTNQTGDTIPNVNDISAQGERHLLEHTVHVATVHLSRLKTRRNMLMPINKLPVELLIHILFLTRSTSYLSYPYVTLVGVCRHWRAVITQNPNFWTLVRSMRIPFLQEILRRSKSAKLDVIASDYPPEFVSAVGNLLTHEIHRIRTLCLRYKGAGDLIQLILSHDHFPSLRDLGLGYFPDFITLLPILISSNHLETLECVLERIDNIPLDPLSCIFGRLKSLDVEINSPELIQFLLSFLGDSSKLRNLRLRVRSTVGYSHWKRGTADTQTVLPELQFLSTCCFSLLMYFQTPKLSCFDTTWMKDSVVIPNRPILEEFDFSLIRCLYVVAADRGRYRSGIHFILGSKDSLQLGPNSISPCAMDLLESRIDVIYNTFPRNYFRIKSEFQEISKPMGPALYWALPRVQTNLNELYLFPSFDGPHTPLVNIISQMTSVEKFVLEYNVTLLDFIRLLSDTSLLPQLKYLCFTPMIYSIAPEKGPEAIGKALTECLRSRQKASTHQLKVIVLCSDVCLPLPDTWLNELRELGTTVATVKGGVAYRTFKAYCQEFI